MALTLSEVVTATRGRHPAFHRSLVPDAVIARYLTGYQRDLIARALHVNPSFLTQQMSVGFNISDANGIAGAGTTGGRPIDAGVSATTVVNLPVGTAAEVDVDGSDVSTLVATSVVASATSTTLTKTGAGWTTNAYASRQVVITGGTGVGQRRDISSNTSTVLTVSAAWATTPDTTSTFVIVAATTETEYTFGAVADGPFSAERYGYLVRLNASGTPYIDFTLPLIGRYDVGVPLPQHHRLVGGTVRMANDPNPWAELTLVDYGSRLAPRGAYPAYEMNNQLFLCGAEEDWDGVGSLDLRYVPIAPALTALTDYFLVPDSAYQALVDGAAYHAALRVNGAEGVPPLAISAMAAAAQASADVWVRDVGGQKRGRFTVIKEWLD